MLIDIQDYIHKNMKLKVGLLIVSLIILFTGLYYSYRILSEYLIAPLKPYEQSYYTFPDLFFLAKDREKNIYVQVSVKIIVNLTYESDKLTIDINQLKIKNSIIKDLNNTDVKDLLDSSGRDLIKKRVTSVLKGFVSVDDIYVQGVLIQW